MQKAKPSIINFIFYATSFLCSLFILVPIVTLLFSSSIQEILQGIQHELFYPSLVLSMKTTICSLFLVVVLGTPTAWWLAKKQSVVASWMELCFLLPIVLPPSVLGIALLKSFGGRSFFGGLFGAMGIQLSFSFLAVVLAQIITALPFYVRIVLLAFRKLEPELLAAARSLGASRTEVFLRVVFPLCLPSMLVAALLAWARALGEFGATLVFAGNLAGKTQTMPLAIFSALESDVRVAVVLSLLLLMFGGVVLVVASILGKARWKIFQ